MEKFNRRAYYNALLEKAESLPPKEARDMYQHFCLNDTYFLLRYACNMVFMDNDYAHDQCKLADDIEFNQGGLNDCLFLWFREGFKSTILNIGKNIQHILREPEKSTLILSNTSPGAKVFLLAIKLELENNKKLQDWFPKVLYKNPQSEAPMWSLDRGLIVKRETNRKEPTIFATGLVDSQPAKVHCDYLCYDDIVTEDSVTELMLIKTEKALSQSLALGTNIKGMEGIKWFVGTRYDDSDAYGSMIDTGTYKVFEFKWHTGDGITPRAHTKEKIAQLRAQMSRYDFACQYEMDPVPAGDRRFYSELKYFEKQSYDWNYILLCDPAGEGKAKRGHSIDNTAMAVVGRDQLGNQYLVDAVYGKIPLLQRVDMIFGRNGFIRQYNIEEIWYEKVGKDSDMVMLKEKQVLTGLYVNIHPFNPNKYGAKNKRIESALMQRMDLGKLRFPRELAYWDNGNKVDIMGVLRTEMKRFPHGKHDDMLDCLAQLIDVPMYGIQPSRPIYNDLVGYKHIPHKLRKQQEQQGKLGTTAYY